MKKSSSDPKVRKSVVRNCEQKVHHTSSHKVIHETNTGISSDKLASSSHKDDLSNPTLCSSEALAQYLNDVKKSLPPHLTSEDINANKVELSVKLTKKLNIPFNNRLYKNLIELNTSIEETKLKKEKKPIANKLKRDQEPNISDFYQDEEEVDVPPIVPIFKPKYKQIRKINDGQLHSLVAAFEDL